MSETKSNASKIEEGRGKGSGASYKPWIQTRKSAAVEPVQILKTGKQGVQLSFSHKERPISGIF